MFLYLLDMLACEPQFVQIHGYLQVHLKIGSRTGYLKLRSQSALNFDIG